MITASSLTRLRNCPSSAVLPRAETHSVWADAGNDEHETLADLANLPSSLAELVPAGSRSEVKLAYDVATTAGRVIGEGGGRAYGNPGPFEIVGSCDVLGVIGDSILIVDWKTGYADVEPASSNAQLWFYALAACRAMGKESAIVRIVYTKTGRVDEYAIDALELAGFADALRRLHTDVAKRQAALQRGELMETREGSWCKHCASKAVCPSKNALLVQFAEPGFAILGDSQMTPARAALAYAQLTRIEQLTSDARKRLQVYVDEQGPIDLGNGRMYGRYDRKGNEVLNGNVAVQAIREVVGESAKEFETIAIDRKTSKAAIARAAKQLVAKGHTKVAEAVVDKIRELGGVSHMADSAPYGEHSADRFTRGPQPAIDTDEVNRQLKAVGE